MDVVTGVLENIVFNYAMKMRLLSCVRDYLLDFVRTDSDIIYRDMTRVCSDTPIIDKNVSPANTQRPDQWKGRSSSMKCSTCIWWVWKVSSAKNNNLNEDQLKTLLQSLPDIILPENFDVLDFVGLKRLYSLVSTDIIVGSCRRHAPTIGGYPAVFPDDWCGDHRVDEDKI
jgi:hypothetical protein